MARRNFILYILTLIIIGALIGRHFHTAGIVISVVAMSIYLVVDARRILRNVINYRRISRYNRVRVAMWVVFFGATLSVVLLDKMFYLLLLILLSMDYLITAKQMEKGG